MARDPKLDVRPLTIERNNFICVYLRKSASYKIMFWKRHPKKFFSPEEQERVVEEIRQAEEKTSGEIRVHLDCCAKEETLEKAKRVSQ